MNRFEHVQVDKHIFNLETWYFVTVWEKEEEYEISEEDKNLIDKALQDMGYDGIDDVSASEIRLYGGQSWEDLLKTLELYGIDLENDTNIDAGCYLL